MVFYLLVQIVCVFDLLKVHLFMKGLLGSNGLLSFSYMEQEAALNSLSTLMSIIPADTYAQFAKVGFISFSALSAMI